MPRTAERVMISIDTSDRQPTAVRPLAERSNADSQKVSLRAPRWDLGPGMYRGVALAPGASLFSVRAEPRHLGGKSLGLAGLSAQWEPRSWKGMWSWLHGEMDSSSFVRTLGRRPRVS